MEEFKELKTLETPEGAYTSFPDQTARKELKAKLSAPEGLQPGMILKVKSLQTDGTVVLEGVTPTEAGEHPDNPVVDGATIGGDGGVRLEAEGPPSAPILVLYGAQGDEPVRVGNVAPAVTDGEAVPLGQIKELIRNQDPEQNVFRMEPAEDDIPCVYLYTGGAGMPFTKDEGEKQIRMVYESRTKTAEYYLTAKVQGSSSASNPNYKKRNWTLKFYADDTYDKKLKLSFRGWPAMNKFVLKAGWVIPGHLRNVGAAQIWGQIMRSRPDYDTLPEELRNSANQGATDGFHVRVFIDGAYWGIYDWIVAKDQLFGQNKDNPKHAILNSEWNNQPTCAFSTTAPNLNGNWSEELHDSMNAETKASMENWIKFVAGSTDEEFSANAENYFDVQSVIDAICFDRVMLTADNMCRNQIVFKYDAKWLMGKWDLDAILGLPPVAGQAWYPYDTPYQEGYVAYKDYGITNMLYQRTPYLFLPRFKENYFRLRKGPLSENNLVRVFGVLSDRLRSIEGLLAEENASTTGNGEFTTMPNVGKDTIQQIREFIVKRCAYMDKVVTDMINPVPATSVMLSKTALAFAGEGTQTITATVEPSDTTDTLVWETSNPAVATVADGAITAIGDGSATITARAGGVYAECAVQVSGIGTKYSVVRNLTNVTTTNEDDVVYAGASYSATLTATVGTFTSVIVTMGGVDVTADVYSSGVINIPAVIGNIVITAAANDPTLAYALPDLPVTLTGTEVDTGFIAMAEDKDITVVMDFTPSSWAQSQNAFKLGKEFFLRSLSGVQFVFGGKGQSIGAVAENTRVRFVVTHASGTNTATIYKKSGAEAVVTHTLTAANNSFVDAEFTTRVGGYNVNGTVADFRILNAVWDEDAVAEYMA